MRPGIPPAPRFRYLDGLRGIAAATVVLHHAFHGSEFKAPLTRLLGHGAEWFTSVCDRGVQIFFVLSGFVIAYSIRDMNVSPKNALNFILRRQIRLDPAFWLVLLLTALTAVASAHAHPEKGPPPSASEFFANMFYVNNLINYYSSTAVVSHLSILHLGPLHLSIPVYPFMTEPTPAIRSILGVSWTLCLEIQFYLILIFLVALSQKFFSKSARRVQIILVAALAFISLAVRVAVNDDAYPWFIGNWYFFAAGALTFWTLDKRLSPVLLSVLTPLIIAAGIAQFFMPPEANASGASMIIGGLAIGLIYMVGTTLMPGASATPPPPSAPVRLKNRISRYIDAALSISPIQYLGRISYSLYLVHLLVLERISRLGMHLMNVSDPAEISPIGALLFTLLAIAASIAVAQLLYTCIERPTMRLASALKPKPSSELPPKPPASPSGSTTPVSAPAPAPVPAGAPWAPVPATAPAALADPATHPTAPAPFASAHRPPKADATY